MGNPYCMAQEFAMLYDTLWHIQGLRGAVVGVRGAAVGVRGAAVGNIDIPTYVISRGAVVRQPIQSLSYKIRCLHVTPLRRFVTLRRCLPWSLNFGSRPKKCYIMPRNSKYYSWKILNNLTNNDVGISFEDKDNLTRMGVTAKVPPLPRSIPARSITLFENSFAVRAPKLWNCLPKLTKGAKTLETFKSSLGSFNDQIPDLPPVNGCIGVNNNSILDWARQNFRL